MRTDSETYSKEFAKECASFIERKYGATSVLPNLESVRCEGRGAKAGAQEGDPGEGDEGAGGEGDVDPDKAGGGGGGEGIT